MGSRRSLSTFLLLLVAIAGLGSLLSLIPWGLLLGEDSDQTLRMPRLIVGTGAAFWALILWAAWHLRSMSHNTRIVMALKPIELSNEPAMGQFRDFLSATACRSVDFFLEGSPEHVVDHGLSLALSPYVIRYRRERRWRTAAIIPALFWRRFASHPKALAAALTHELAHVLHRDLWWLVELRRIMWALTVVAFSYTGLSLLASTIADSEGGTRAGAAMVAAIVGKGYLVGNVLALATTLLVVRRLRYWREALADRAAVEAFGADAVDLCEQLVSGGGQSTEIVRAHRDDRLRAMTLTWREVLLFGAVVGASAIFVSAPLGMWSNRLRAADRSDDVPKTVANLVGVLSLVLPFYAALWIDSTDQRRGANSYSAKRAARMIGLLVIGVLISEILLSSIPIALASIAVPSGFGRIYQYRLRGVMVLTIASNVIPTVSRAMLALSGVWLAEALGCRWWIGVIPGLLWAATSTLEQVFTPGIAEGWISVSLMLVVLAPGAIRTARRSGAAWRSERSGVVALGMFTVITVVGFLGWGDIGHFAACSSQAGFQRLHAGDMTGALASLRRAAIRSRPHFDGWMDLAEVEAQDPTKWPEAVRDAETALHAPYLASLSDEFRGLTFIAAIRMRLQRPGDLQVAEEYLRRAVAIYRRFSNIPESQVASVFYNFACLMALNHTNVDEAVLLLTECAALDRRIAEQALDDPDLAVFHLRDQPLPRREVLNRLAKLHPINYQSLRAAIGEGWLDYEQLKRCLAFALKTRGIK